MPEDERTAARWAAASMELGALVCTAKNETCQRCPIAAQCAWRLAGKPEHDGPARRGQTYAGTDRQVRGKLLAVLREAHRPVPQSALDGCGTSRCSAPGRSTGSSRTVSWSPSRTACTACPLTSLTLLSSQAVSPTASHPTPSAISPILSDFVVVYAPLSPEEPPYPWNR